MPKFKKRPVVIEAFQFAPGLQRGEGFFESDETPQYFKDAVCGRPNKDCANDTRGPHIHTLEGIHYITVDDWIIRGVAGEFYPCKPDIFFKTYELVG